MNHRFTRNPTRTTHRCAGWLAAAAAGLTFAAAAVAQVPLGTIEECLETGTRSVRLPGTADGTLSASPCTGCPNLQLRFDTSTVYLLGKERVTYAQFREVATKGDIRLDLFYRPQTRVLTRMRLAAARDSQ